MKLEKSQSILLALVLVLCGSASFADTEAAVLNANSATADEIAGLPHMDEVLAEVIVSNRPFVTIGEMNHLLGSDLDEDQLEELYSRLFVPIDLNNASRTDILLIPGVGGRMAHEFEEYRPYSNIEQFRREIGNMSTKKRSRGWSSTSPWIRRLRGDIALLPRRLAALLLLALLKLLVVGGSNVASPSPALKV